MHYEYAVEPRAIASSWQDCRYISELFGFDRGRVLSQFPRRWLALALESIRQNADISPMQKKRIEVKLRALKRDCGVASGRDYNSDLNWMKNALNQQDINPFQAIIAKENLENIDSILALDDVEENHPLMAATNNITVSRNVESLAAAFTPLLKSGRKIAFVDPFVSLYDPGYRRLLSRCFCITQQRNVRSDCQISLCYKRNSGMPEISQLERDANQFSQIIPQGMHLDVYCWDGQEISIHDRYLLSDRGGIGIGWGFQPADSEITQLNLLDVENARFLLEKFVPDFSDDLPNERPLRIFADGTTIRL